MQTGKINTYWANTSSTSLVGKLIREGNRRIREQFERSMQGEVLTLPLDEQIVYDQLKGNDIRIWK